MPRAASLALLAALVLCSACLAEKFELNDEVPVVLPDECDVDDFTNCVCKLASDQSILDDECDDNKSEDGEDCFCIFEGDCDNTVDPGCVCFLEADEDAVVPVCVDGSTPEEELCFCNVQDPDQDDD